MVNKTVLDNGIRVITEEIDHVRSVSLGAWVDGGSRHESGLTNGIAHFIEHMLFKGTRRRSAFEIAAAIDGVGGVMNAATGKELTSFYIKIPDYHLEMAIDLLADLFTDSCFDEAEIGREKSVILQEIRMVEDTPDDYVHDFFDGMFWGDHPLALPVLGTKKVIEAFGRDGLLEFFRSRYCGRRLVLTAAGRLQHDQLVEWARRSFGSLPEAAPADQPGAAPVARAGRALMYKNIEQVHLIVGFPGPSGLSPERHAGFVLNSLLGGSMSSRLFQEIREKRGLAYDVGSFLTPYRDAGLFGIYAGTGQEHVKETLRLIHQETERICSDPLGERELCSAKELLKGHLLLGMESTDNRMTALAKSEICFGRQRTPEEIVGRIDAVSSDDVRALANRMFRPEALSIAALGPVREEELVC